MNSAHHLSSAKLFFIVCFTAFAFASSFVGADEIDVVDIQGNQVSGRLQSWFASQIAISADTPRTISLAEVHTISFGRPFKNLSGGSPLIRLSNGDRITARPVTVIDDAITLTWPLLASAKLPVIPLEKTAAIVFELPTTAESRCRLFADLDTFPAGTDLVMLLNGDRTAGEFQKLDTALIELKAGTSQLKLDRSKARAIRLNPELANISRPPVKRSLLKLVDGSLLTVTDVQISDGQISFKSVALGALSVPVTAVSSCEFFSERLVPLADREPAKYEFTPFLSSMWEYTKNANVLHGPLTLRGNEYPSGIGVHSRSSISYSLKGNERSFRAVVGIDDIANGLGSALFAVEVDGRNVWSSPEMTGKSPSLSLPEIDLRGAKQLTLIVDFGQFADVSDYANWCDAILICDPVKN